MEMRFVSLEARRRAGSEDIICFCTGGKGAGQVVDLAAYRGKKGLEEAVPAPPEGAHLPRWLRWAALAAETMATMAAAAAALVPAVVFLCQIWG